MEPDAALGRAARDVVLDAVALEDVQLPVVHLDRDRDDELAFGASQHLAHSRVEPENVSRPVELREGDLERVHGTGDRARRIARAGNLGLWHVSSWRHSTRGRGLWNDATASCSRQPFRLS